MAKAKTQPKKKPTTRPKPKRSERGERAERFDRAPYAVPPLDLDEALELAAALSASAPARPSPSVAEELVDLAAARARAAAASRGRASPVETRAHDVAMDRAWSTFVRRIEDHVALPRERRPAAEDAAKVFAIVRDLSILKLNYFAEFAQIGARIDALRREGLLEVARAIAGAPFLDEVFHCHAAYGEALGVGEADESVETGQGRGEARLQLLEAIGEYSVQVLAQARAGRIDSWAPVAAALAPIVLLRQAREAERAVAPARPAPPAHPPIG